MAQRLVLSGLALTLLAASPALAQDEVYARTGPYVGVAGAVALFVRAEEEVETSVASLGIPITEQQKVGADDVTLGVHARAGYRFHPNFAGELHFEWLNEQAVKIDLSPAFGGGGQTIVEFDTWVLTADVKAYPLTGQFQPFLTLGAGLLSADAKEKLVTGASVDGEDFTLRLGGGFDYYVTENVALQADLSYVLPFGEVDHLDFISLGLGLNYRF